MSTYIGTPNFRKWTVRQGRSICVVVAATYHDAKTRAAQIGFQNPDSIVLNTSPDSLAAATLAVGPL